MQRGGGGGGGGCTLCAYITFKMLTIFGRLLYSSTTFTFDFE